MSNEQNVLSGGAPVVQRPVPVSDLDFDFRTVEPNWGKEDVPVELRSRLGIIFKEFDEHGNEVEVMKSLWDLLGYYTRDMRLANLSQWNNEFDYCVYYLDLAGDLLREGYIESFCAALARTVTILELSQSKAGFFRKLQRTRRNEDAIEAMEPPKKPMWGKDGR